MREWNPYNCCQDDIEVHHTTKQSLKSALHAVGSLNQYLTRSVSWKVGLLLPVWTKVKFHLPRLGSSKIWLSIPQQLRLFCEIVGAEIAKREAYFRFLYNEILDFPRLHFRFNSHRTKFIAFENSKELSSISASTCGTKIRTNLLHFGTFFFVSVLAFYLSTTQHEASFRRVEQWNYFNKYECWQTECDMWKTDNQLHMSDER